MSCCTIFSVKLKLQPTYEELRTSYVGFLKREMSYLDRHISNCLTEDEQWLFEDKTIEDSIKMLSIMERQLKGVENGFYRIATLRKGTETLGFSFCERNQLAYRVVSDFYNVFRIGKYPDDELMSLSETLSFFEKNENRIFWGHGPTEYGKSSAIEVITEFWMKYPDGRIHFT